MADGSVEAVGEWVANALQPPGSGSGVGPDNPLTEVLRDCCWMDAGTSRKCASAGSRIRAPSMLNRNMKASRMPMSAWNLIGEKDHVATARASVMPVSTTTLPVNRSAL
ncbi:hypothetical protein D3C73_1491110 [compost metagenome]